MPSGRCWAWPEAPTLLLYHLTSRHPGDPLPVPGSAEQGAPGAQLAVLRSCCWAGMCREAAPRFSGTAAEEGKM